MTATGAVTPLPAVVLGGYLGAGKTTLINELLRQAEGQRIAVLVNDFGDIAIDAELIVGASGDVVALAGGCVCCSFGADLLGTLQRVLQRDPAPQRVLVECSGVGLPAAVARTLRLLPALDVRGVVTVVDALRLPTLAADPYVADTVGTQIGDAGRLVLNQIDRVGPAERQAAHDTLAAIAPGVPVLEAAHAAVPADWVWQVAPVPMARDDRRLGGGLRPSQPAAAGERFRSECRRLDAPIAPDALRAALAAEGDALQRVKGWFTSPDGRRCLVQGTSASIELHELSSETTPRVPDRLLLIRRAG